MNAGRTSRASWLFVTLVLIATRLPAFVEPAGNDQSLYMYVADRVLAGGVPYVDAWDQKPPAVFFVYAAIRAIWPYASAVALADLIAATFTAWALVLIGRRLATERAGWMAANLFLLFGHPSLARLSGVYVRGQCEVFLAAAVAIGLALMTRPDRRPAQEFLTGIACGVAFWLKYNALVYLLPIALAAGLTPDATLVRWRLPLRSLVRLTAGFAVVSAAFVSYFAMTHALGELRVATIDYNLAYSAETYQSGLVGMARYLVAIPPRLARTDFIWFLGVFGALGLIGPALGRRPRLAIVALAWLIAALASIAINGARDLPQYFVQAAPALALAAAVGIPLVWRRGLPWRLATFALMVAGLWKVGVEPPGWGGLRWGGVPKLVENVTLDVDYWRGRVDQPSYLARFKGAQKYDAQAIEALSREVGSTTGPNDRILVFGFAPGVYVQSERLSASRFFWSRPVVIEFASGRPGYGSAGLLADLQRNRPALVALQKLDWGPGDPNSEEFFLTSRPLADWLRAEYRLAEDTPLFSIWRRMP